MVSHPSEWSYSGYDEIQSPRRKCPIIDYQKLAEKAGFQSYEKFKKAHEEWVDQALSNDQSVRQSEWSESLAVGSERYINWIKEKLGVRAIGRSPVADDGDGYQLRDPMPEYTVHFAPKKEHIAYISHLKN